LILSSHDPLVFESGLVERVVEVRDGRVVEGESEAGLARGAIV
jgi:hypothetical protein